MAYKPETLPFAKNALRGISEKTIETHYEKLYKGYVNKYNEIQEKIKMADLGSANQNYSQWRGLKVDETFNTNSIFLHELYFGNLGGDGDPQGTKIYQAIGEQYGSFERFKDMMTATGMVARGWAVAAWNPLECDIHIFAADAHNAGAVWSALPFLVLDVYEHAYYMDFGSDRAAYIKAFWENVEWEAVDGRYQAVEKI